jgi:plastocyanin
MRPLPMLLLGAVLVAIEGAAADFTVAQKDRAFSVRQLTVKVGDQVTFVNDDTVNHNVYSETKGLEFDFVQRPGRADSVRFSQPGVAEVSCAIHPVMKLQIRVTP